MHSRHRAMIIVALCTAAASGTAQGQLRGLPSQQSVVRAPHLEVEQPDAHGRLPIKYSFPGTPASDTTKHRLIVVKMKGSPTRHDYSPNQDETGTYIYDPGCLAEGVYALSVIGIAEPRKEAVRTTAQVEYHANHTPKIKAAATRSESVSVTLEYDLRRSRLQNVITIDWIAKNTSQRAVHFFVPSEQGIKKITLKNVPADAKELVVRATACDGSSSAHRCVIEDEGR